MKYDLKEIKTLSDYEAREMLLTICDNLNYTVEVHLDLFGDVAVTLDRFCDMFNCNTDEERFEAYDLDWWYLHKINRRLQNVKNQFDEKFR